MLIRPALPRRLLTVGDELEDLDARVAMLLGLRAAVRPEPPECSAALLRVRGWGWVGAGLGLGAMWLGLGLGLGSGFSTQSWHLVAIIATAAAGATTAARPRLIGVACRLHALRHVALVVERDIGMLLGVLLQCLLHRAQHRTLQ